MEEQRIRSAAARFWVSQEIQEEVRRIAQARGETVSSVYRDLVEKGLVAGGYRSGSQDLTALVREAVQEALRPHIERLASISAKGTQISAAAFFLAAYNGRQTVPDYIKGEYDELAANARKLGAEYLKLSKDRSLDEFLAQGLSRMGGGGD